MVYSGRFTTPMPDSTVRRGGADRLPWWAHAADAAAVAALALGAYIALFEGFRVRVAGVRLSLTSAPRAFAIAAALLAVRHLLVRHPPIYARFRLAGLFSRRGWLLGSASYAAAILVFAGTVLQFYQPRADFTRLIAFGDLFQAQSLPAVRAVPHFTERMSAGYDGQFYAQLAVEPLLRDRAIDEALDTPEYRGRRILFSWTAYLLGLGQPEWILKAYAAQNLIAWGVLAWLLLRWLPPTSPRHFVAWLGCLFGVGLMSSVRMALIEGPSMVLIALAVLAAERRRTGLASAIVGLSGLGRETNVLSWFALADRRPQTSAAAARLALTAAVAAAPLLLWLAYLRTIYPTFTTSAVSNLALPFSGYLQHGAWMLRGVAERGAASTPGCALMIHTSLTVQALFLVTAWQRDSAWWRVGVAYCALFAILNNIVWEGYPGAAARVLLPMTVAFNVLAVRRRWCWAWLIPGNLFVVNGLAVIEAPFFKGIW